MFVYDILLLAHSVNAMQEVLKICEEFAFEFDMKFNSAQSVAIRVRVRVSVRVCVRFRVRDPNPNPKPNANPNTRSTYYYYYYYLFLSPCLDLRYKTQLFVVRRWHSCLIVSSDQQSPLTVPNGNLVQKPKKEHFVWSGHSSMTGCITMLVWMRHFATYV